MGIFTQLLKKKPKVRIKRQKAVTFHHLEDGSLVKTRLIPWLKVGKRMVWLGSIANARSNRQINDWLMRRKNRRTRRLDGNLTGKSGNKVQAIAVRALREWVDYIPAGDSVVFRCESAMPAKQFRVWKKWILRHDWDLNPDIDEDLKSFFFYKPVGIE
jgi:hypothetical protein